MGPSAQCQSIPIQGTATAHSLCRPCVQGRGGSHAFQKQKHSLQLQPRWPGQFLQHRGRHGRSSAASRPVVPDMPFPGDDQGSTIYSALSGLEDAAGDLVAKAEEATSMAMGSTQPANDVTGSSGSNGTPSGEQNPKGPVPHRWIIVGAMALAFVLCNMDKVNMSVAVIPMAKDLGWSPSDRGLVNSAFFWGYSLTQIPAGWVSTRIGGAKVLMAGVVLWSLGTLVAPPAAKISLLALCASRVFVGLGEGLAPSSATNVMARLVPEKERARAVTAVFGALDVGSAVGLLVCGPLIHAFGWPSVFYLFAVLGLLWSLLWPLLKPEQADPDVPAPPPSSSPSVADKAVPWGVFLRSKPVWAIIVAHFAYNWGYYTLLAWLPSYFELSLGLNVESSSLLTLIPYLAMTAMTPFVGPVADGLVSKGWSVTNVRKLAQGVAFAGPALCMVACALLTPAGATHGPDSSPTTLIVALFSAAFAMGAWARAGLYCNHQDLSPEYAGALLGLSNTAGALPGILGVTSVGFLLDKTQSWGASLFYPTAICQVVGLIIYTTFASSKRQTWATD